MAKSKPRCLATPDLFGAPMAPATPTVLASAPPPSWQQLEAERIRGLHLPQCHPLAHPWFLQAEILKPGLTKHLAALNAQRTRAGKPPYPAGGWRKLASVKGLPQPAVGLWLLDWVVKLADDLAQLTTLYQQRRPQEDPELQQLRCVAVQSLGCVRQGLYKYLVKLNYAEAHHWEWVHAVAYWRPTYIHQMARKADWQRLAKEKVDWVQHPGSRPSELHIRPDGRINLKGLPPPYPRWIFQLHLESLGPLVWQLVQIMRTEVPLSPLQRTFYQTKKLGLSPSQRRTLRVLQAELASGQHRLL